MGGTITLNGKTYNLSLISAVYTERILQTNNGEIILNVFWCLIFQLLGIPIYYIFGIFFVLLNTLFWCALMIPLLNQLNFSSSTNTTSEYSLIFEIGGKKEVVFSGNVVEVENIKNDIIIGIEKGYFPNYLQGR